MAVNPPVYQLDHNGFLRIAGEVIRLRAPDDVQLSQLYSDSKLLMDLVLKGLALKRQVGAEAVRVTSLGKAEDGGTYTDHYGRIWQVRTWSIPYGDIVFIGTLLAYRRRAMRWSWRRPRAATRRSRCCSRSS